MIAEIFEGTNRMDMHAPTEKYPRIEEELYKILLVDDEEVVRHGLKYFIDWKSFGFRIANDVGSSAEALELLASNHYDVLLTDIQMPGQNGLELIERIRRMDSAAKILIISGYDSFEYAVAAIRCGVEDYLLKPFSRERVEDVFRKLYQKLRLEHAHRVNEQMAVSYFLYHLVQNDYVSNERIMDIENALGVVFPSPMLLVNFCFADFQRYTAERMQSDSRRLFLRLHEALRPGFDTEFELISCRIGNNCLLVLPEIGQRKLENLLRPLLDSMCGACRVGISESVENLWELSAAYCQTIEILHGVDAQISFYCSGRPVAVTPNSRLLVCQNKLIQVMENGCQKRLEEMTGQIFELLGSQSVNFIYNWCLNSIYAIIEYFDIEKEKAGKINFQFFYETSERGDLLRLLQSFYEEQLKEILRLLQRLTNDPNKQLIEQACRMIEENYADSSFYLNVVAEKCGISYGYLSTIFKQITHENFMDHLLRVRMQNAKRLLTEEPCRIYEVAEKTGYNSSRYFTLTFRKYFGMTPSEYTKKIGGKK